MSNEKYFVLNIKQKNSDSKDTVEIYNTLSKYNINELNIPFVPLESHSEKDSSVQVALPQNVDHGQIVKMVSTVRDELDVTLLGAQSKERLNTNQQPSKYGLDHFILGEEYEGLDE